MTLTLKSILSHERAFYNVQLLYFAAGKDNCCQSYDWSRNGGWTESQQKVCLAL